MKGALFKIIITFKLMKDIKQFLFEIPKNVKSKLNLTYT